MDARALYEITALWIGLILAVLASIGAFITTIVNVKKTSAETRKLTANQLDLHAGQGEIKETQEQVLAQFKNNGGSTLKDSTDKIEELIHETRSDLRGIRRDIGRLSDVDKEDRDRAVRENEKIYAIIAENQNELKRHIDEVPVILEKHQKETLKFIEEKKTCV